MDVASVGGLTSALSATQTGDAASVAVLKKAMEIQAQSAAQLLQALPQPASNPPNLGNTVDIKV